MKCFIEKNLIFEKSLDFILEKIKETTLSNNIINLGIFPNIFSKKAYFSGRVSMKSKLYLTNEIFDITNPLILLKLSPINNYKDCQVKINILPNFVFMISAIIVSLVFLFISFLLFLGLFTLVENKIGNMLFSLLFLVIIFLMFFYMFLRSKNTLEKTTKILELIINEN